MITTEKTTITVEAIVQAPVELVWKCWIDPNHITKWNFASDDWVCPWAKNDLRVGGKLISRMESIDGKMGFDFEGEYTKIDVNKFIEYFIADGRKVQITFSSKGKHTVVTESFEAENQFSHDMQRGGWQAILDNFKKHVESTSTKRDLYFEIFINAPVEKVYQTMLDEKGYKRWTAAFNPTSCFKGSWNKGSKMLFLGTDQNGEKGGMVSRIAENIPNKFVSIEYHGIVKGDKEIMSGPDVEKFLGGHENYTLSSFSDGTKLSIVMTRIDDFESYFYETWPKALALLKEICEE